MKIVTFKKILVLTLIVIVLSSNTVFGAGEASGINPAASGISREVTDTSIEYLQSVIRMTTEKYKGEITVEKLMDGALKGMLDTIDQKVRKLTPDESNNLLNMVDDTYEGIGVLIENVDKYAEVKKVFSGSPAEASGIEVGDRFYEIDGVNAVGMFTIEISSLVKGPVGSKVKITLLRGADEKVLKEVTRGKISINPVSYETKGNIGYLQSAISMFREQYKGSITERDLMDGALKGLFDTMDQYTKYYNANEASSFFSALNGTYEGIGVVSEKDGDYNVIVKVYLGSPAEKAGIVPGDKIVKIDGISVLGASSDDFVSKVKGPADTIVRMEIIREGKKLEVEIKRAKIVIAPVTYEIDGDIGYIKLNTFSEDSHTYMAKAVSEMDNKKIKKVILDLRDNGGGYVDQAYIIAQNFVPMGLFTRLDYYNQKKRDVDFYSYLDRIKYKLAVLVNGNTASASEILAGAIQDTKAGTLIGTKTYGKAKFQEIVQLITPETFARFSKILGTNIAEASKLKAYGIKLKPDELGGYTKITVGTYTTPKGRMIDQIGLTPDIVLENPASSKKIDVRDIQKLSLVKPIKPGQYGADIFSTERILALAGYSVDAPDFTFDPKTFSELKKFQMNSKLKANGQLDLKTQEALNDKLIKLHLEIDLQYAKAIEILNEK